MKWKDQYDTVRILNKAYGRKIAEKGINSYGSRKLWRIINYVLGEY